MKRVLLSSLPQMLETISTPLHVSNNRLLLKSEQLMLKKRGIEIHAMLRKVGEGLLKLPNNLENDPRAQWIFHPDHQDAHNEYALTAVLNNEIIHVVIDRTFIDKNNIRWIVDYKITEEIVLEDYRLQLEKYAKVLRLQDTREIHLGIYSPLTKAWIEWRYD